MADENDARLELLLRSTLRAETADLAVTVRPEDVLVRRQDRRIASRRWLPFRVLAIAAAVALPLAAIIGTALSDQEAATDDGAIIVRGLGLDEATNEVSDLEVILVDNDGREHGLVRYDAARFELPRSFREAQSAPAGSMPPTLIDPSYPKVSKDGWLVFDAYSTGEEPEGRTVLVDLTDPQREPVLLEDDGPTGWGPDGALWRYASGRVERIDPDTDQRRSAPAINLGGFGLWHPGTWALAVAEDGSGPVMEATSDATGVGMRRSWGVMTLDDPSPVRVDIPAVAPGVGARLLSAEYGLLQVCSSDHQQGSFCPDTPRGTVVSGSAFDRPFRTWGEPPGPNQTVLAASWAGDGGVWKIVDRRDGGRLIDLVHISPSGEERRAVTWNADLGETNEVGALAADDSLIALTRRASERTETALADTRTGVTRRYEGQVAGFVSSQGAIDWLPGSFQVTPGHIVATAPVDGSWSYSALPQVEMQMPRMGFMLGQQGRPATGSLFLSEEHPEVAAPWAGKGMCDFFGSGGVIVPEALDALTGIIEAYESEQARVCASMPNCHTDEGLLARYADVSSD
jgi:hypothetical protein